VVRAQKVIHGNAKEARPLIIHREQTPPSISGDAVPVWVRDGWSTSEKQVLDDARRAGPDSPIIYVYIPRASAEDLRKWIIDAAAADETIHFKGVTTTPEGDDARRSLESRRDDAVRNRTELVRDIVGNAKVFQGGGTEMLQLTLDAKLKDATDASLVRLFPRFKEADSAAWGIAVKRAREGADQPFGPVGHTGATEQHAVCQEVLLQIGVGKLGTDLRKMLEASPFGWPRDAVDAALIALHRSQHLKVALNGAVVPPGQLDQNKIPKAEFRVDSTPLPVSDRLVVRGLIAALVSCKNGEEAVKAPEFLSSLKALAAAAGGIAPMPTPPVISGINEVQQLSGNELLTALRLRAVVWKGNIEDWQRLKVLSDQRRPAWDALERLAKHAKDVPAAASTLDQVDAVRNNRMLLAAVDPVSPLRSALADLLRRQLLAADAQSSAEYAAAVSSLESNPTWGELDANRRTDILHSVGLTQPIRADASTEDSLVAALDARPLSTRASDADVMVRRAQRALEQAAKALEPTVRPLSIDKVTLRSEDDVRAWLTRTEVQLLEAVKQGPVLVS
jgi:hypothetical protein